jgi:hypothetical protein
VKWIPMCASKNMYNKILPSATGERTGLLAEGEGGVRSEEESALLSAQSSIAVTVRSEITKMVEKKYMLTGRGRFYIE